MRQPLVCLQNGVENERAASRAFADALGRSTFSSRASEQIMRSKYAKLLRNLGNAVKAICGPGAGELLAERAREEGREVLRGAAGVGTDHLNGEIVMLGRLTGTQTPVNRLLGELTVRMLRDAEQPGWLAQDDVLAQLQR